MDSSKQLRILIALQYYIPHRTGLTLHVQRVAEELARRGHKVTVVSARYDASLPRDEQMINGVRVVRLWAPIRVSRGMVMPAYPWAALRLMLEHDVVSLHTPALETALFGIYSKLMRRGLVITHHGDLLLPKGLFNQFVQWFTFLLYLIGGWAAYRIIAYSKDYASSSYYVKPFKHKTSAVYPPISIPQPQAENVKTLRAVWLENAGPTAKLIGYAGRFVEEKRPDVLLNALPTIHRQYPGSKIVFAGQYNIKYESFFERHHALIGQLQDHVIFLGLLDDDQDMANFYAAIDVLALPSDTECFALVQVEAMICGTPVVATDIPGARVVVKKTGMGLLVPPRQPEALGQAISEVLSNRERYHHPPDRIMSDFNFQVTIDRYEKFLCEAVQKTDSRGIGKASS